MRRGRLPPGDRVWVIVVGPEFKTPPSRITVLPLPPRSMIEFIFGNPLYIALIVGLIIAVIVFFLLRARSRRRAMQREIEFDEVTGMILAKDKGKKGEACIKIFDLNRGGLPEARKRVYDNLLARMHEALARRISILRTS